MKRLMIVLAAVLSVSACAGGGSVAASQQLDAQAYPVVADGQAASILQAVEATRVRGVDPKDNMAADPRIVGPFRLLSSAQATIDTQLKKNGKTPSALKQVHLLVPAQSSWPRFFVAVGQTSDESTPVLQVLSSANARSPYGLYAQPVLLPGATLPDVAASDVGAAVVAPDASGYLLSPQQTVVQYADYLTKNARSASSKNFRRSTFSDQIGETLATDQKNLKSVATLTSVHTASKDAPLSIRTQDGGALVIGTITQTYTITVKKGKGSVAVQDKQLAALAGGRTSFKKSFVRTSVEVVVFRVPPAGSGSAITVIAAERGDTSADLT